MYFQSEKIKNILPYFGSLLILCGYIKLSVFYSHFGIKISDYLEISEILTLFLSDAFIYILITFAIFLYVFITDSTEEIEQKEETKEDIIKTEKWLPRLVRFLKFSSKTLFNLALFLLITVIGYFIKPESLYYFILMDCLILILLIFNYVLLEYNRKHKIIFGENLNSTYNNLILTVFIFLLFVFGSVYSEIKTVEKGNIYFVCFKYFEKDYQSQTNYLYLGQTKNYLFMYDNLNDEATIFSRKDIANFNIKTNEKYR